MFVIDSLDSPEFLLIEFTKVEGFKEKLEFTRFKYRVQWHLFEIGKCYHFGFPHLRLRYFLFDHFKC